MKCFIWQTCQDQCRQPVQPWQLLSSSSDEQPFGHNRHGTKIGGVCPIGGGVGWSPSNIMWPRPRPTSLPSGILIHPAVSSQKAWAENWGRCAPFFGGGQGSWVSIQHRVTLAEAYLHTKWHLDPSSRLATIGMCRKFGGCAALFGGSWVPI